MLFPSLSAGNAKVPLINSLAANKKAKNIQIPLLRPTLDLSSIIFSLSISLNHNPSQFCHVCFYPPTQETTPACCNILRRASTALAVEECVNARYTILAINLSCFGGFRSPVDDPPKPWRRWVWFWGTTGLPVGLHFPIPPPSFCAIIYLKVELSQTRREHFQTLVIRFLLEWNGS